MLPKGLDSPKTTWVILSGCLARLPSPLLDWMILLSGTRRRTHRFFTRFEMPQTQIPRCLPRFCHRVSVQPGTLEPGHLSNFPSKLLQGPNKSHKFYPRNQLGHRKTVLRIVFDSHDKYTSSNQR